MAVSLLSALLRRGRSATRLHQQLPPPRPELRACVIIPAKNEAANLPATLAALAAQTTLRGSSF